MVVPMKARGRTLGALMLVSSDPARLYDDDALTFAEHLGRRAAVGGRQRAALQPFGAARAGGARARLRRRRRHARRRRRHRADLERGRRGDHRPAGARTSSAARSRRPFPAGRRSRRTCRWPPGPGTPRAETVPVEFAQGERWLSISGVALPGRHRVRVPRPDRGAARRAAEERVRLDDLARAPHAARRDLRRRAHPAARGARRSTRSETACSTSSPPSPSASPGSSTTSSGSAGSNRARCTSQSRAATPRELAKPSSRQPRRTGRRT